MLTATHPSDIEQIAPVATPAATVLAALLGAFIAAQASRGKEQREEIRRLVGGIIAQAAELRDRVGEQATASFFFGQAPPALRWQWRRVRARRAAGNHLATALNEQHDAGRQIRSLVIQLEVIAPAVADHAQTLLDWSSAWPNMEGPITPKAYHDEWPKAEAALVNATRVATSRWPLRRLRMPKGVKDPAALRTQTR